MKWALNSCVISCNFANISQNMQSYILSMQIPNYVIDILKILESHGFEAYIVGGCVRDSLLGLSPKDWDITSNAEPMQTQQLFSIYAESFEVIPIGLKYGTLGIRDKKMGNLVEITTYRFESEYKDGRRPECIQFAKTLQEDLSRRDFSINALACKMLHKDIKTEEHVVLWADAGLRVQNSKNLESSDCHIKQSEISNTLESKMDFSTTTQNDKNLDSIKFAPLHPAPTHLVENLDSKNSATHSSINMQLFDYHNGIKHLCERKIACVGNAQERFLEDSLRIMRAIRFASVLPFSFQLSSQTKEAVFLLTQKLSLIANERIQIEFTKLLCGQYAHRILSIYKSVFFFILPPLKILNAMQSNHNFEALSIAPKNIILRLSLLFCPLPYAKDIYKNREKLQKYLCDYQAICKQLHFDNKTIQRSQTLLQLLCNTEIFTAQNSKIALKYLLSQHDIEIISQLILLYVVLQKTHEALGESNLKDSILQEMPPYSKEQLYAITKDLNEIIINKECYKLSQLSINGIALQDIAKSMGITLQGKQIGILLTKLLHAVIEEEIPNTFHSLESRARFYIARL
ncbi:MAG: polynucleotide adenylyltransferase [Helicobacter sp.]|uniref:CCA tRNA nucleotidyltransferase n=1 Tax=Helicobacter sp. TaxID=218 RepID=UPI002A91F0CD|nr:polynucleotide adenylyltransferase [Helicobacter sp.]MDY5951307.1 polynucleotide adenylyltransferase [Helicobacter sp.]